MLMLLPLTDVIWRHIASSILRNEGTKHDASYNYIICLIMPKYTRTAVGSHKQTGK